jgi:hypothetical protein
MTKYKFFYFGDRSVSRSNVVTVAAQIIDGKLHFGASFSHISDHYVKATGKFIAIERLHADPIIIDLEHSKHTYGFIQYTIARYLHSNNIGPSWTQGLYVDAIINYEWAETYDSIRNGEYYCGDIEWEMAEWYEDEANPTMWDKFTEKMFALPPVKWLPFL